MSKEGVCAHTRAEDTSLISHSLYEVLHGSYAAPDFSRESWTSVKCTLGLDFPNVSCVLNRLQSTTLYHAY